ncbi:hypothetical protein, partial [Intestinimonas butyriciproducens]|uniref:hypothetical protein n=1 Tax=Intestinimonas butyriciproducens TaxID=1297617 RepID=UPI001957E295
PKRPWTLEGRYVMVLVPSRIAGSKRQSGNCPLPETLRTQAEADFRKLEAEFSKVKGGDNSRETFQVLAEHFRAHTIEDDFMDFNYGALTATILMHDGAIELDTTVEVWDDGNTEYFGVHTFTQLTKTSSDAQV